MPLRLFGFELLTRNDVEKARENRTPSIVPPTNNDAAMTVTNNTAAGVGSFAGNMLDLDQFADYANGEVELINRYRELALQPEVDEAIGDIINELIVRDDDDDPVTIDVDALPDEEYDDAFRDALRESFDHVMDILNFRDDCYIIARQFYVDGRLYYDVIIDESEPERGILEVRNIDPRMIRPVREIVEKAHVETGAALTELVDEYYVFNREGFRGQPPTTATTQGIRLTKDRVVYINSGVYTPGNVSVLSHLHKALRIFNQLRMIEDASVIYRITRAPERRVFYIDVGDLPTTKAAQYVETLSNRYRNRMVYDGANGHVKDDRKFQSMQEDFWLPRKSSGRGTEVQSLPGGTNLGEMEDVEYFRRKLYKALNIPLSRLEANQGAFAGPGRATEIGRDEIKFNRFLTRLRTDISQLFDELMARHLVLRKVLVSKEQWRKLRHRYIRYRFAKDSQFAEIKQIELLTARFNLLQLVEPYIGKFASNDFVFNSVLHATSEEQRKLMQTSEAPVDGGGAPGAPDGGETVDGDIPIPGVDDAPDDAPAEGDADLNLDAEGEPEPPA